MGWKVQQNCGSGPLVERVGERERERHSGYSDVEAKGRGKKKGKGKNAWYVTYPPTQCS